MEEGKKKKNPVSTSKRAGEKIEKKTKKNVPTEKSANPVEKPKGKSFEENIIRDSETARERGRNGGLKSQANAKAKKEARESVQYFLGQMTRMENVKNNLKELGVEVDEYSNMMALIGKLWTMAMGGNLDAFITLMKLGGYDPEEVRKERESIAADRRRELELDAKVAALGQGNASEVAMNLQDEDGTNDVVIYMPQIDSEEDCELAPEGATGEETPE